MTLIRTPDKAGMIAIDDPYGCILRWYYNCSVAKNIEWLQARDATRYDKSCKHFSDKIATLSEDDLLLARGHSLVQTPARTMGAQLSGAPHAAQPRHRQKGRGKPRQLQGIHAHRLHLHLLVGFEQDQHRRPMVGSHHLSRRLHQVTRRRPEPLQRRHCHTSNSEPPTCSSDHETAQLIQKLYALQLHASAPASPIFA
jgi:hypothetical protein